MGRRHLLQLVLRGFAVRRPHEPSGHRRWSQSCPAHAIPNPTKPPDAARQKSTPMSVINDTAADPRGSQPEPIVSPPAPPP
ncbi:hypothetical protein FRAHR75_350023 [Frankia sp. Hr75.2]|nr:hypothetical protein FRAHR75_350023 [Frankia sp. Hr75.2]